MKILDWWAEKGRIRIRFPYDPMLLAEVKLIGGRQWHREDKFWSIPVASVGEAGRRLLPLGFEAAPEVEKLLNGEIEGIAGLTLASNQVNETSEVGGEGSTTDWSVSRLNHEVRAAIRHGFPGTLWLQGEVVGADRSLEKSGSSAHLFFRLVEKGESGPLAEVSAVMWSFRNDASFRRLEENGTPLEDGLKIRVRVSLDLYVDRGQYQVIVEEIDPDFTLGELARRREEILAEIRRLGIDRENLDLEMPPVPLRVGVVTSPGSDAWKDFIDELEVSGFAFEVSLHGARVQGDLAEQDLLRALEYFSRRFNDFDVVVVIRGGGSKTDLMAFDTLDLARAVALHPVKVVVGIGHHADRSVLDELAHSEKTPTAVGQYLVSKVEESWDAILDSAAAISDRAQGLIEGEQKRLRDDRNLLRLRSARSMAAADERRKSQGLRCHRQMTRAVRQEKVALLHRVSLWRSRTSACTQLESINRNGRIQRLQTAVKKKLADHREALANWRARMKAGSASRFERDWERHEMRQRRNQSADPKNILGRGFAWIKNSKGKTVRETEDVDSGDMIHIRLKDGSVDARVE